MGTGKIQGVKKLEVLQKLRFGERVAEEEMGSLEKYFVETDQWRRIYAGEVDVIYGPKGSGKSALYSLVMARKEALKSQGIRILGAENPRGTAVFNELSVDPPSGENEFIGLWKLYFLSLVGSFFREHQVGSTEAGTVISYLEEAGLVQTTMSLSKILRAVRAYVSSMLHSPKGIESGVSLNPLSGMPEGITGRILFQDPTTAQTKRNLISVEELFRLANHALEKNGLDLWIMMDRLDVAFAEHQNLEENALRALFRSYLDLIALNRVKLKIFLRTDIWKRVTQSGFREASHITRVVTISWDRSSLLNLVIRRVLQNQEFCEFYKVNGRRVLSSAEEQKKLFYMAFPEKVKLANNPETFDWMCSRTQDGTKYTAPRELIHLLNATREEQIARSERGEPEPEGTTIFDRDAIKRALRTVSDTRLTGTLYAEYPTLKPYIEKLSGQKTSQTLNSLSQVWASTPKLTAKIAAKLVEIGFFELRGTRASPEYWVPFLYRDATGMIQGEAE